MAATLLSYHNVYYMMRLMRTLRESIIEGTYPAYVADFMLRMYPDGRYPEWAEEALLKGEISLVKVDEATAKAVQAAGAAAAAGGGRQNKGEKKLTKKQRQKARQIERKVREAAGGAAGVVGGAGADTGAEAGSAQPKRSRTE